jgi:hypothetical protein
VVAAWKISISLSLQGLPNPTQILSFAFHSNQGHLNRSAVANFSRWRIPRPPNNFGQQTISQLTLHLAPVVESFATHTNTLSILLMYFKVPGGTVRGVRW